MALVGAVCKLRYHNKGISLDKIQRIPGVGCNMGLCIKAIYSL